MENIQQKPFEVSSALTVSAVRKRMVHQGYLICLCIGILFLLFVIVVPNMEPHSSDLDCFVTILMFALSILVINIVASVFKYRKSKKLDDKGISAPVQVKRWFSANVDTNISSPDLLSFLFFQLFFRQREVYFLEYDLPEGICIKASIPSDIYRKVRIGDIVFVHYLPDQLDLQRIELQEVKATIPENSVHH